MRTYYDLEPQERGNLTEDEVRSYCDLHLMIEGVPKPMEPAYLDETPIEVPTTVVYVVKAPGRYSADDRLDVAFTDPLDAEAFLALDSLVRFVDEYGNDKYIKPMRNVASVESTEVPSEADRAKMKAGLDRVSSAKSENTRMRDTYNAGVKACTVAIDGIWEDYRDQVARKIRLAEVASTFEYYIAMANGDEETARRFLAKVATEDEVEDAIGDRGEMM